MKITDVKLYYVAAPDTNWTFVEIETDAGLTGLGEATNFPGSDVIFAAAQSLKSLLVGENPEDIERLWHKVFRYHTYLGSRGVIASIVGGMDIALWDLKGRILGRPVYDLLGGAFRNPVPMYTHVRSHTPDIAAEDARLLVSQGWKAMKLDPLFHITHRWGGNYVDGHLSFELIEQAAEIIAAVRSAVGPHVEILAECHGNYNVPTAIRLARALEPFNLTWFEEPLPCESWQALQQVKAAVHVPICVGERHFTRWDYVPIFENRLADYVMPDVIRTGGISELRKIANMAEAYNIPVSPHDANGPVNILAGAHVMAHVPNCYRVEIVGSPERMQLMNNLLDAPLDIRGGAIMLPNRPGLGYSLNREFALAHEGDPAHRPGFYV